MSFPRVGSPQYDRACRRHSHMRHALGLAARALAASAPNPGRRCVIVSHQAASPAALDPTGGRRRETVALAQAGSLAGGSTVYVTLEPCSHHGQTAPCAEALNRGRGRRVVASLVDPDPRVHGEGLPNCERPASGDQACLRSRGRRLNAGFFNLQSEHRPLVALKIAESADGFVADASGKSRWITSEAARRHGHLLRAQHEVIMSHRTVLADDPC